MTLDRDAFRDFDLLTTRVAKIDRPGRAQVHVTGADAVSFLQSLLSQDLAPLGPGAGAHGLLLAPQGKLDHDLRILIAGSADVWLDAAPGSAGDLVASLARFKIRVEVTLTDCSHERRMITLRGPLAPEVVRTTLGVAVPEGTHSFVDAAGLLVVRADWPDNPGVDILGPSALVGDAWDLLDVPTVEPEAFERLRIVSGVPVAGVDIDRSTIPQEAFLERDAVSFTKGCFLGQELVCRIDSRGHVNRRLRILRTATMVPIGATVEHAGTDVGRITSSASTPDGGVALGILRREVEPDTEVRVVTTDGVVPATAVAIPGTEAQNS